MKCHDRENKRTGELAQLPKQINELESENKPNTGLYDIFSLIFENISEGIIISDIDNRILHINKSIEKLSGYSRQELIGKNIAILNGEKEAKSINKT